MDQHSCIYDNPAHYWGTQACTRKYQIRYKQGYNLCNINAFMTIGLKKGENTLHECLAFFHEACWLQTSRHLRSSSSRGCRSYEHVYLFFFSFHEWQSSSRRSTFPHKFQRHLQRCSLKTKRERKERIM